MTGTQIPLFFRIIIAPELTNSLRSSHGTCWGLVYKKFKYFSFLTVFFRNYYRTWIQ